MTEKTTFEPTTFFHLYNRANGLENLFLSDKNYRYFLKKYADYIEPIACTYAYCLMPNHFHFLVQIKNENEILEYLQQKRPTLQGFETFGGFSNAISQQFSNFLNGYVQAFNTMYKRKGSLFRTNLKRKPVDDNSYLAQIAHYIHYNPVKHGFTKSIDDWPWSSWQAFLSRKPTLLKRKETIDFFGN